MGWNKAGCQPTPQPTIEPPLRRGQHTEEALADWGFTADEVAKLRETGAVAQSEG